MAFLLWTWQAGLLAGLKPFRARERFFSFSSLLYIGRWWGYFRGEGNFFLRMTNNADGGCAGLRYDANDKGVSILALESYSIVVGGGGCRGLGL